MPRPFRASPPAPPPQGEASPSRVDVAIVGGGIVGAATAYHLAKRGGVRGVVLEKEPVAGYHATGRNAALAYRMISEKEVMELAVRGGSFLRNPPADFPEELHNSWNGSLTLASGELVRKFGIVSERLRRLGVGVEMLDPGQAAERVPILRPETFERGFFCGSDGIMDIHAMLQGYLKGARRGGIPLCTRCRVQALRTRSGRVTGLDTDRGPVTADRVVIAAGPWSNRIAATAHLAPLPLKVCRRHLIRLDTGTPITPGWPLAWDVARGYYVRPEGSSLLFSPCDQDEMEPHDAGVDRSVVELAAEKALALLRGLENARVLNAWSGLRTLTPDNLFVLGPDPRLRGLYWAAGLCGHGMTTSWAVGELMAGLLCEGGGRLAHDSPFSPGRFL